MATAIDSDHGKGILSFIIPLIKGGIICRHSRHNRSIRTFLTPLKIILVRFFMHMIDLFAVSRVLRLLETFRVNQMGEEIK